MIRFLAGFIFCLLFFAGCAERTTPKTFAEMAEGDVVVRVNGEPLTYGDFSKRLNFETALYRQLRKNNASLDFMVQNFRKQRERRLLPVMMNGMLLAQEAKRRKVEPSQEDRDAFCEKLRSQIPGAKSVRELPSLLGVDVAYFQEQVRLDTLNKVVREAFDPSAEEVSEKEIDEGLERQRKYTARAVASNEVLYAHCTNVFQKIQGGLDFSEAAKRYSQGKVEEGVIWDTIPKGEIEDLKLRAWAFTAPLGSVGIFDLPDGLNIVKLIDRTKGAEVASPIALQVAEATFARIQFLMLNPMETPFTRDQVRNELLKWKRNEAQKRLLQQLHDSMKLEYPHGSNFWAEAKSH